MVEVPVENIDLVGSWVEVGMIVAVFFAGAMTILFPMLKRVKKSKNTGLRMTSFNWDVHSRIHEVLSELRVRTDCARSQVVQFHNGGVFLDGISMKKMSLTHESLANGCSSEMETKRDLLLSLCLEGLSLLMEDSPKLHIVEQLEDSWCKNFMQSTNIISFCFLPIRKNGEIIGYVMCQWCSWSKTDVVDESQVSRELETARNDIEVNLSQQLKRHK